MKLLKRIVLAFSVVAFAVVAQAQSPAVAVDTATQTAIGNANTTETYEDSAREASQKTSKGSTLAKAASVFAFGMAAYYMTKSPVSWPKVAWYTAGGIAGLMLAKSMDKTSNKNNAIADTFVTGTGTTGTGTDGSGGTDLSNNGGDGYTEINNAVDDLTNRGIAINTTTGEFTVNGKKYKATDFSSPESMAAAGMSQSDINGFLAAMKEVKTAAEAKVGAADAVAGYEDGGSGGSTSAAAAADESYGGGLAAKQKYSVNRDPSNVAGLSKMLNGEPIGVANDGLFSMITRRYGVEQKKGAFIGPVKP